MARDKNAKLNKNKFKAYVERAQSTNLLPQEYTSEQKRIVKSLSKDDLVSFQNAILKDYGIRLEGDDLYDAAFNLLHFIETLIKFDQEGKKEKGSKIIQDNPLNKDTNTTKME